MHTEFLKEILKGRDHSKDSHVGRRIILKWLLGKLGGRMRNGFFWLG
jgi:hypothetical protein